MTQASKKVQDRVIQKHGDGRPAMMILAAAVAAAAGTYFFAGKRGAKNRKVVLGWMVKAKGEVMERLEGLKEIDFEKYADIVDTVLNEYKGSKKVAKEDLADLAEELKAAWKDIEGSVKKTAKKN